MKIDLSLKNPYGTNKLISTLISSVWQYSSSRFLLHLFFLLLTSFNVHAQKGLFAKFSIGPGFTSEYQSINNHGVALVTKNHAIGWGVTDRLAIQMGEFGSLNKLKTGDFNYINLDALGLGFSYKTELDLKLSFLLAYSQVAYAKEWWEPIGTIGGKGLGINISIDKEWIFAKRWGFRLGPQLFWIRTSNADYRFFNASLNGSLLFYLTPVR